MVKVKVKEEYYKTKLRPLGILLNVNAMIYLTFKLQLKFSSNKNYSPIIVYLHTGLHKEIH